MRICHINLSLIHLQVHYISKQYSHYYYNHLHLPSFRKYQQSPCCQCNNPCAPIKPDLYLLLVYYVFHWVFCLYYMLLHICLPIQFINVACQATCLYLCVLLSFLSDHINRVCSNHKSIVYKYLLDLWRRDNLTWIWHCLHYTSAVIWEVIDSLY